MIGFVVAVLYALFRFSRRLLGLILDAVERRRGPLDSDGVLVLGFGSLLAGMLLLPLVTWGLAFADSSQLPGGMILHLALVCISIILFSLSEDLFGSLRKYPRGPWGYREHFARIGPALVAFWALGALLLSPLFYTGLTLVLAAFYAYALSCRTRAAVPPARR